MKRTHMLTGQYGNSVLATQGVGSHLCYVKGNTKVVSISPTGVRIETDTHHNVISVYPLGRPGTYLALDDRPGYSIIDGSTGSLFKGSSSSFPLLNNTHVSPMGNYLVGIEQKSQRLVAYQIRKTSLEKLCFETVSYPIGFNLASVTDTGHIIISNPCLLYTSPSPQDRQKSRMPSSA